MSDQFIQDSDGQPRLRLAQSRRVPVPAAPQAPPAPTFVPSQGEPAGLEHLSDELLAEKLLAGLHTLEDRLP